jgi:hypothetical protein
MVPSNVGHLQAVFNVAAFELARQLRRPDPDRGPVSLRNFAVLRHPGIIHVELFFHPFNHLRRAERLRNKKQGVCYERTGASGNVPPCILP